MRRRAVGVPDTGFHFDEPSHSYFFDGRPMTGCTTILGVIAKPALIAWAAKMATEYIRENVAYAIPGQDGGFWAVKPSVVEEAKTAHAKKRDKAADDGTALHATVEQYIKLSIELYDGRPTHEPRVDFAAIQPFIEWAINEKVRFIASEIKLYSKEHWIAGTADFIFEKDGKRYIGDIKTYKKIWDRVPLIQCAGYSIMWEEMQDRARGTVPAPIDGYCVVCLPKERSFNPEEDVLWSYDTEGDREAFLSAVRLYRYLNNK
jgi:hypothetical protein